MLTPVTAQHNKHDKINKVQIFLSIDLISPVVVTAAWNLKGKRFDIIFSQKWAGQKKPGPLIPDYPAHSSLKDP